MNPSPSSEFAARGGAYPTGATAGSFSSRPTGGPAAETSKTLGAVLELRETQAPSERK